MEKEEKLMDKQKAQEAQEASQRKDRVTLQAGRHILHRACASIEGHMWNQMPQNIAELRELADTMEKWHQEHLKREGDCSPIGISPEPADMKMKPPMPAVPPRRRIKEANDKSILSQLFERLIKGSDYSNG